ncbi:hypothetical protein Q7P37_009827 [Cladosporium fusiforme]
MEGKVVAITGGASGIGLSTAKLLASRGAKVSIADIREQKDFDEAVASIQESACQEDDVLKCKCDVRDVHQVSAWLKATVDKWGRLDHVASVAGVWQSSKIDELEEKAWEFVIGVNLTGTMHVLKESIKLMPNNAGCSIVVVASVCGLRGYATQAAYCASKHGAIGLTRCAAIDVGPRGIRVNCVAPGMVETPLSRDGPGHQFAQEFSSQMPIARVADASEIASVICFLLGKESSFVTGSVYTVDGGCCC